MVAISSYINPYVNTYVSLYSLDAIGTSLSVIPGIPPIMKIIANAGTTAAKVKIIHDFVKKSEVPPAAKALAGAVFAIGSVQSMIALFTTMQEEMKKGNFFK